MNEHGFEKISYAIFIQKGGTLKLIEINKKYSLNEVKAELGITKRAWDTRREEVLEYLKDFFDYEINYEGREKYFICYEILGEYIPLPRKTKKADLDKFYKDETIAIVEKQPLNTGTNIARIIIKSNNKFDHAELTAARYVRPVIKDEYEKTNIQWCKLDRDRNIYYPLTEEQNIFLQDECFQQWNSDKTKNEMLEVYKEQLEQYISGHIGRKDFCAAMGEFTLTKFEYATKKFELKYGFRPMPVPTLVKKENTPT